MITEQGFTDQGQQEGARMSNEHIHPINVECHGCMDGRPVIYKAKKVDGVWTKIMDRAQAAEVVEARLPGGALGFIAALENAGVPQDRAIEITKQAMASMGMEPQIHIDNEHGHFDFEGKSDQEIFDFIEGYTGGCGFAARTWGADGAKTLIQKLKDRGWLLEVLDGGHKESAAKKIAGEGVALDVTKATVDGKQSFSYNPAETQKALKAIQAVMNAQGVNSEGFVAKSMDWFDAEFPAIAKALRDINDVETV